MLDVVGITVFYWILVLAGVTVGVLPLYTFPKFNLSIYFIKI